MAEKLRILCLHGYLQNAETFLQKSGSLRKALKAKAELVFVTAPHSISVSDNAEDAGLLKAAAAAPDPHGWWTWQDAQSSSRPSLAAEYIGVDKSLEVLEHTWISTEQPFDGVLGFSQGSTMAALFLAHLAKQHPQLLPRFCILVAGFLPRDPYWAAVVESTATLSTCALVVHGQNDRLVPLERSEQLQRALGPLCTQTILHPGGHMIPTCSGDMKHRIIDFVREHEHRQISL